MSITETESKAQDGGQEKELLLRLAPQRKDAVPRDRLRDALGYIARRYGWDLTPPKPEPS